MLGCMGNLSSGILDPFRQKNNHEQSEPSQGSKDAPPSAITSARTPWLPSRWRRRGIRSSRRNSTPTTTPSSISATGATCADRTDLGQNIRDDNRLISGQGSQSRVAKTDSLCYVILRSVQIEQIKQSTRCERLIICGDHRKVGGVKGISASAGGLLSLKE